MESPTKQDTDLGVLAPDRTTVPSEPIGKWKKFYRGTLYQAIILGLVSFTQPGIWDAMNNLGAGGLATPFFSNAANVITYVIMVLCCPISAVIANRFNVKWVLVFGTIGYVPYFAALYCNSVYGTQWFLLFGAALCGFSAAGLWTAEAAMAVGYPELKNRGVYIAIWLGLQKIGSVIGTSIQLALNIHADKPGSISPDTYLVLIGLSCAGLPLAMTLSPPDKVIRSDGTRTSGDAPDGKEKTVKQGLKSLWEVCKKPYIVILIPTFITARWAYTYQGMYLTAYFSVRGRTLAGFIATIISLVVTFVFGWFLDSTLLFKDRRTTARTSWVFILASLSASLIYSFVLEADLSKSKPELDISSPGYGRAVGSYCLYRVGYEATNVWQYWVLGTFDIDVYTLTLTTALLRSFESLGLALAFAVGASSNVSLMTNLAVAAGVYWASAPTTTWAAWRVKHAEEGEAKEVA